MLPHLAQKCLVADAVTGRVQVLSLLYCKVRWVSAMEKTNPSNRAGVHTDLTSSQGASPLHHRGTHCWSYCAVAHSATRTQAEFEWGVRHLAQESPHGWCVPSVLPVNRGRCGFTFTSQPNPELAPAPPAGCGWADTAWMPWEFHTAFGAGLYESQTKAPMLPLTLPLLCIFHCFLISSTALVFVSRGHFLHSA